MNNILFNKYPNKDKIKYENLRKLVKVNGERWAKEEKNLIDTWINEKGVNFLPHAESSDKKNTEKTRRKKSTLNAQIESSRKARLKNAKKHQNP